MSDPRGTWRSSLGFVLATAGASVGLGNVWRFPTMAAYNGGGAFLIPYVALVLAVGIPAMLAEFAMGRAAARGPVGAFRTLSSDPRWAWVGRLATLSSGVLLSYYSVIAGWCMAYTVAYAKGWSGVGSQEAWASSLTQVMTTPHVSIGWHAVFMILTAAVVAMGIQNGIERANRILMPMLLLSLMVLAVRVLSLDGAVEGLLWLFAFRWDEITGASVLAALSQVFYSLSLAGGTLVTYASYLPRRTDLPRNAVSVAGADLLAALLSASVVIPALYALQLPIEGGPGLVFGVFTRVFQEMPMARLFGFIFYLLVSIAALTSSISLLEIWVTTWIDERRWTRPVAVLTGAALAFLLGIPSALSQAPDSRWILWGRDFLTAADFIVSSLVLPTLGVLTAIFVGWIWGTGKARRELEDGAQSFRSGALWELAVRYLVPVAIALVILGGLLELS